MSNLEHQCQQDPTDLELFRWVLLRARPDLRSPAKESQLGGERIATFSPIGVEEYDVEPVLSWGRDILISQCSRFKYLETPTSYGYSVEIEPLQPTNGQVK